MKRSLLLICILLLFSCTKVYENNIPYAMVYIEIDLRYSDKELKALLSYKEITQKSSFYRAIGYSGVLVVHGYNDIYYAYDLCCPHEADKNTRIIASNSGTAQCPKCKTIYDIANQGGGYPIEGPSKSMLTKYAIITKNSDEFSVQN